MNRYSEQFKRSKSDYRSLRYPGDLANDLARRRSRRTVGWLIPRAALAGLALSILHVGLGGRTANGRFSSQDAVGIRQSRSMEAPASPKMPKLDAAGGGGVDFPGLSIPDPPFSSESIPSIGGLNYSFSDVCPGSSPAPSWSIQSIHPKEKSS